MPSVAFKVWEDEPRPPLAALEVRGASEENDFVGSWNSRLGGKDSRAETSIPRARQ